MDRAEIKDIFVDVIGGTSLDDATVSQLLTESLKLLNQLTAHIGVDFLDENPLLVINTMQYYLDIINKNLESATSTLKAIKERVKELHFDFVQTEQADYPNYMGDRG